MLIELTIQHFVLIEHAHLEFTHGFSAITGETGAGKSVLIDALECVLGGRTPVQRIQHGQERAEIVARFDISKHPHLQQWLQEQGLFHDEHECLVRRTLQRDGKSRAYIDSTPVPLHILKEFSEQLLEIHGQHQHLTLLKSSQQMWFLDQYGNHADLLEQVKQYYQEWNDLQIKIEELKKQQEQQRAQQMLLTYQCQELEALNPQEDEYEQLIKELKLLHSRADIQRLIQEALNYLDEDEGHSTHASCTKALQTLRELAHIHSDFQSYQQHCESIQIQLDELNKSLRNELNPNEETQERLEEIEQRSNLMHQLARKYQVRPEQLPQYYAKIQSQSQQLKQDEQQLALLLQQRDQVQTQYQNAAQQLSQARSKAIPPFNDIITQRLTQLGMPHAEFKCTLELQQQNTAHGIDHIKFLFRANAGQPLQPLNDIASGGELSRLSLAIEVTCRNQAQIPILVFDEVDVGVGGETAHKIGQMLQQLGQTRQVFCITHLPQVAAKADHQYHIEKIESEHKTTTHLKQLTTTERIQELARMLGGISPHALEHAKSMLQQSAATQATAEEPML